MGEHKAVQIYKSKKENHNARISKGSLFVLTVIRAISVFALTEAWWSSLQSVFEIQLTGRYFYLSLLLCVVVGVAVCTRNICRYAIPALIVVEGIVIWKNRGIIPGVLNHLANAWLKVRHASEGTIDLYKEAGVTSVQILGVVVVLTIPLVLIWVWVMKSGRGRILAIALMVLPILCAAFATQIPPASACWTQVLTGGIYLALVSARTGKAALGRGGFAFAACIGLVVISVIAGKGVELSKRAADRGYRQIRTVLTENVEKRFQKQDKADKKEEAEKKEPEEKIEEEIEEVIPPTTEELQEREAMQQAAMESGGNGYTESSMDNLNKIAEYRPRTDMPGITVRVIGKPDKTVYYPERYGGIYEGGSWEETLEEDAESPQYSQYPQTQTRLIELCRAQQTATIKETEAFIRRQLEQNTTYDFKPGATPAGKDFAEYFLFDNKKGFCVHFATTATLLYRIQGYQARYAEGFAIPATAFTPRDNDVYEATITGDMGHAWCEVYEDGWQVREHTLSYIGEEEPELRPAADSQKAGKIANSTKMVQRFFTICTAAAAGMLLFYAQYAVRRRRKYRSFKRMAGGKGFRQIYRNIYDIGVYQGMDAAEPLSEEAFEQLKRRYSFIQPDEWEWIKEQVLSNMFYNTIPQKADHERLYHIYRGVSKNVQGQLTGIRKIRYKYLMCLD